MIKPVGENTTDVVSDGDPGQHHPDHAGPGVQRLANVVRQQPGCREFQHHDAQAGDKDDGVATHQEPPGSPIITQPTHLQRANLFTGSRLKGPIARAICTTAHEFSNHQHRDRDQPHHQQGQRGATYDQPGPVVVDQVEAGQKCPNN